MAWSPKNAIGLCKIELVLILLLATQTGWAEDSGSCPELKKLLTDVIASGDPVLKPNIGSGAIDGGKAELTPAAQAKALATADKAGVVFKLNAGPTWRNRVGQITARIRNGLRNLQDHTYPIIALDDATPVHAHALAADAFQRLTDEQRALVNLESIKVDLFETLKSVENYKIQMEQFIDQSATTTAQVEALELWLKNNPHARNFTLELPTLRIEDGKLVEGIERTIFPDDISVRIKIRELKRELRHRLGFWQLKPNGAQKLAVDQAIKIKRLETFRSELIRQELANKDPAKMLPDDLRDAVNRINALYDPAIPGKIKQELRPPGWAEEQLKILQTHAELKTFVLKAVPSNLEKAEQNKIVQFVKQLKPEDKQALGINKFANAVGLISRSTWITRVVTATTSGGGLLASAYELKFSDRAAKEKCASSESEDVFVTCVREYLVSKFAGRFALVELDKLDLINGEGQISDPRIVKEIKDVKLRRAKYLKNQNRTAELDDATRLSIRENGISEEKLRLDLVESKADEDFKTRLTAPDSYFAQKFPSYFKIAKSQLEQVANVPFGSEKYFEIITEMRRKAPTLTDEFESIADERDRFKTFGTSSAGSYDEYFPSQNQSPGPRMTRRGQNRLTGGRSRIPDHFPGDGWNEVPQNSDGTIPVPQYIFPTKPNK
ncbi:MAG: hypothetical protein A2Z97_14690 [Bdellovibrionales bacterium GWB1_52_6]|nr:MAG: hypothetical protein A2Z97_14690 [Bdellovibrionales bacterium GWB1_52_6]